MDLGTSSPAKPTRVVEYPGSRTRAEISSRETESVFSKRVGKILCDVPPPYSLASGGLVEAWPVAIIDGI